MIVGAFLTQNTAWTNVDKALRNLRGAGVLNVRGIRDTALPELEQLVRPAGYFRQKAQRLKNFVQHLDTHYSGSLGRMFARPTGELRGELLSLNGIGPETADSILLYAGGHASFVVDAYTRRIFERHAVLTGSEKYEAVRELFRGALKDATGGRWQEAGFQPFARIDEPRRHKFRLKRVSPAARIFDEYHALLVQVAKHNCFKKAPECEGCPLEPFLPVEGPVLGQGKRGRRKKQRQRQERR